MHQKKKCNGNALLFIILDLIQQTSFKLTYSSYCWNYSQKHDSIIKCMGAWKIIIVLCCLTCMAASNIKEKWQYILVQYTLLNYPDLILKLRILLANRHSTVFIWMVPVIWLGWCWLVLFSTNGAGIWLPCRFNCSVPAKDDGWIWATSSTRSIDSVTDEVCSVPKWQCTNPRRMSCHKKPTTTTPEYHTVAKPCNGTTYH